MRARLCRWHSGEECLPPGTRHLQVVWLCNGSPGLELRLIEQACGCSTVRGGVKVCVLGCLAGTRVKSATPTKDEGEPTEPHGTVNPHTVGPQWVKALRQR